MNFNYLKIAWRILLKNKVHTIINILGLGLGFSVSILMMIFVYHQLSFDNFHSKSDRIFRFTIEGVMTDGKDVNGAMTNGEVAAVVSEAVPEIEYTCRIYHWGANVPINSHLQFDMVAAFHTLETSERNGVKGNGISFPTYLLMRRGADVDAFMYKSIYSADVFTNDIFNKAGIVLLYSLQPLEKVYLHSDFSYNTSTRGDIGIINTQG